MEARGEVRQSQAHIALTAGCEEKSSKRILAASRTLAGLVTRPRCRSGVRSGACDVYSRAYASKMGEQRFGCELFPPDFPALDPIAVSLPTPRPPVISDCSVMPGLLALARTISTSSACAEPTGSHYQLIGPLF